VPNRRKAATWLRRWSSRGGSPGRHVWFVIRCGHALACHCGARSRMNWQAPGRRPAARRRRALRRQSTRWARRRRVEPSNRPRLRSRSACRGRSSARPIARCYVLRRRMAARVRSAGHRRTRLVLSGVRRRHSRLPLAPGQSSAPVATRHRPWARLRVCPAESHGLVSKADNQATGRPVGHLDLYPRSETFERANAGYGRDGARYCPGSLFCDDTTDMIADLDLARIGPRPAGWHAARW
jgi:hypothetical protein